MEDYMGKILVAYFSHSGNTKKIAEKISLVTGGDLFEIRAVNKYPEEYSKCTELARKELMENIKPQLAETFNSINDYDIIFLGYPIWWGTMPMPVFTFLERCKFDGKTIMPFCTHGGGGSGKSSDDIKKLCPRAEVMECLQIKGTELARADEMIRKWIKKV
jgi:flavodoxin